MRLVEVNLEKIYQAAKRHREALVKIAEQVYEIQDYIYENDAELDLAGKQMDLLQEIESLCPDRYDI